MQPGVTVVLATVWLYGNVVGTASLNSSRFSLDQYSPLAPHHELYQRVGGQLDWKDQSPVGNQPFDLPIDPRRSSSASPWQSFESKYLDKDPFLARTKGNSAADDFSPLVEDKRHRKEFTEQKIDGTKDPDQPAGALSELEDPFVADDTFQDQGPGSMEIYKLDLLREKSLLSSTPLTRYLLKGKGKAPKKTNVGWKTKTPDFKSTSPKMFHKQSNSFDDLSTEVPPNSDPFSIGGVPELQVGCEGLEASDHKSKRSIEYRQRNTSPREMMDTMAGVTPISLDLDYDFSSIEEEEMDELLRLKKLETTTKGIKQNRGDMEATRYSDFLDDKRLPEKLPVRGDLGKSNAANSTGEKEEASDSDKAKREAEAKSEDSLVTAHQRRRILWLDDSDEQVRNGGRPKRGTWGFGEDEGVVSSDELQTENQRRRQSYEWKRKEEERRRMEEAQRRDRTENRTNSEVERIRQEYERALEERVRQEEERQRRLRQDSRRRPQELDDSRRYEEERRRQEEVRRREEEARRRQQEEQDRQNAEQRRREWMLKMRQAEEERRRQQSRNEPSNLLHPMRATPNESRPYYADPEGRSRERNWEYEQKLREYMQRNRPINPADRQREELKRQEEERRRMEEHKLQEYIRRNQPVHVANDGRDKTTNAGPYNWSRYPGPDVGRRNHGPSAPTNIDPRSYVDGWRTETSRRMEEDRQRQQEQLRKEALRREEEARRSQSRRYEEQRKRLEAERREEDRKRQLLIEQHARRSQASRQENRPSYDDRIHFVEHGRRQDTSLIPGNLVLNQSRRAMEMERQRQERQRQDQERWRLETERRKQEESRAQEAREREERARAMKEQWRRQEEARLNALPVSAKIIVQPADYSRTNLTSRIDSERPNIHTRLDPDSPGIPVPTGIATRPPPPVCASAVIQCCPSNSNRLVWCFEAMGCPGVNWDINPCRISIINAARKEIMKFYEESAGNN